MSERRRIEWSAALRDALGLPGIVIALLSLLMFVFGVMLVRRDFGRLERLSEELPRQVLGRWIRTASADYLSVRNLVDEAEAWRRARAEDAEVVARVQQSVDRLGAWFESQNARAPLLDVVHVELRRSDHETALGWKARVDSEAEPVRTTRVELLQATKSSPAVWADLAFRPDPDLVALGRELGAAYRRLLVAVLGLSGYSLLCLGFMAFHAHAARQQSARDAARQATLDLADRTCHELGNVAFVLTNEGRNLDTHVALLDRLRAELPDALATTLARVVPGKDEQSRLIRALGRELSRRGLGLETDVAASTSLAREAWRQIEACSSYIGLTVRELDTYLRQSDLPVSTEAIDVTRCVDEAVLLLRSALDARGVRVERSGLDGPALAYGDRRLLLHALVNLIKNAIEATRESVSPIVSIRLVTEHGLVRLEVSDNGPGVSRDLRGRIFERGVSTKGSGHGQGLAVARESLEIQGGRLDLVEGGPGACFCLTLPAKA